MHTQIVPLSEVAAIITGIAEDRGATDGTVYRCFQPNSFNEFGEVEVLPAILRKEPVKEEQLVRVGDVLVKRLNHNYPYLVKNTFEQSVVSPNLFIVRPRNVSSAYIAFLFEQPSTMAQIAAHLSGTEAAIKAISAKALMNITIPLLALEKQEYIGELWLLNKRRKLLLNKYIAQSDRMLQAVTDHCMKITEV